jgi:hypothetical protein
LLRPVKPYLENEYIAYHGRADLYVYFFELALRLLRPGGRLGFVVTNKWLRTDYGEKLRKHLGTSAWVESAVDLGHAKQVFEDADVFPSIFVLRKPDGSPAPPKASGCTIPREQLRIEDLSRQIAEKGFDIPRERFGADAWLLEPQPVYDLYTKIRRVGRPLREFLAGDPLLGIKTGLNEAFLIDSEKKNALVKEDSRSAELLHRYIRGEDIERWRAEAAGEWMLAIKSSNDYDKWPWAEAGNKAESVFAETYPAVYRHLKALQEKLVKRTDKGRYWWELRSCDYWDKLEKGKIVYQEIQFHPAYALGQEGVYGNNKLFFLPTGNLFLLGVLNSPLMWWFNWRHLVHLKDEALSPQTYKMVEVPIAPPSAELRMRVEDVVTRLIDIASQRQQRSSEVVDWLRVEYEVTKPSKKLLDPAQLTEDELIAEVRKLRGKSKPLNPVGLKDLREAHAENLQPLREEANEAEHLETALPDLVNAAYGLTVEEKRLVWETAPPRMPLA